MMIYRLYRRGLENLIAEFETLFGSSEERISGRQALTALVTLAANLILGLWYATFVLGPAIAASGEKLGVFDGLVLIFAIFGVAWLVVIATVIFLHRIGLAILLTAKYLHRVV